MAPNPEKKTRLRTHFLISYVSLRNDFANDMRSKKNINKELERVPGYTEVFKPFIVRECFICELETSTASLPLPNWSLNQAVREYEY